MTESQTTPEGARTPDGGVFGILAFSLLCAAIYFVTGPLEKFDIGQLAVVVKWLSTAGLALLAWRCRWRPGAMILALGLLAHSVGDVLIATVPIQLAIVAFLVGHLIYLVLFFYVGLTPRRDRVRISTAVAVLLAGAGFMAWILPRLGEGNAAAVVVYSAVIVAMALVATQVRRGQPWIGLGAAAYLISDAMIATDTFVHELSWDKWATWPLYYLGQLAIVYGIVWGKEKITMTVKPEAPRQPTPEPAAAPTTEPVEGEGGTDREGTDQVK